MELGNVVGKYNRGSNNAGDHTKVVIDYCMSSILNHLIIKDIATRINDTRIIEVFCQVSCRWSGQTCYSCIMLFEYTIELIRHQPAVTNRICFIEGTNKELSLVPNFLCKGI